MTQLNQIEVINILIYCFSGGLLTGLIWHYILDVWRI